jgi:hypothetical protein
MNENLCAHCERRSATTALSLCRDCNAIEGVAVLYERRRGWTPEWERHLIELTRRASARLPLFVPLHEPEQRRGK